MFSQIASHCCDELFWELPCAIFFPFFPCLLMLFVFLETKSNFLGARHQFAEVAKRSRKKISHVGGYVWR